MAGKGSDWRVKRAHERRRVAALNASGKRDQINSLLAGGSPCVSCHAYAVRYSVLEDRRRCVECGVVQPRPAA